MSKTSASLRIDARLSPAPHRGTREVGIVVFSDVLLLDASGPADVLGRANHHSRSADEPDRYRITAISSFGGEVVTSSGLRLQTGALPPPEICAFDTLIVAGGPGVTNAKHDLHLRNWLRAVEPRVRRIGSVCTGAYVLAESGFLSGRSSTTHWGHLERFAELYPDVQVLDDALFARDGKFFTSAGATAGIDLALSLVDEDFGRDLALAIARELVVFRVRSAGQGQHSAALNAYGGTADRLSRATDYILAHLEDGVTVEQVAEHVCVGTRQLSRTFKEAFGLSPSDYIRSAQVDLARELLSGTHQSMDKVALRCGFSGRQQMVRVFERLLGVTPMAFRQRAAQGTPKSSTRCT
ncbi:helix-turn-helix domain-containing protein [Acidovorax sp. SUPP2539]|uniref:GlxA family transcriptional regulator n=1 Tax=Acidovorax sp. SUPP2539 TaxID=2920878 RepID=UPI0024E0A9A1|nr:helix-turn-helix domain-containing protein [Acidovorax sp. SUPP2539]